MGNVNKTREKKQEIFHFDFSFKILKKTEKQWTILISMKI